MSGPISDFATEAVAFCSVLAEPSSATSDDRLDELAVALCRLCAAALRLRRDDDHLGDAVVEAPAVPSLDELRDVDRYWLVLDPYEPEAPVEGSLLDDLGDVYSDVAHGLILFRRRDQQSKEEAAALWRFTFDAHWGRHAWGALAALHAASQRRQPE